MNAFIVFYSRLTKQSMTSFLVLKGAKYSMVGLMAFGIYRYVLPNAVTDLASSTITRGWTSLQRII